MKGKIDSNGWLRIERSGKERLQECPYTQKTFQVNNRTMREPCGDWCPLFGEPFEQKSISATADGGDIKMEVELEHAITTINLCQKALAFDEFTDERGVANVE